ncbi:MAG: MgtC/SapB family protein [Candidatus Eremiobacteraeota bacterium]|nr:MgtC/SapB family protein [Candidatus Eremiobacteraeota bacterium]
MLVTISLAHLLGSAILGGIVGVQRQVSHKAAGFRTHVLVALGSCAFMEISLLSGDDRIAAGVITGIGFLGAGSPLGYAVAVAVTALTFAALSFEDKTLARVFRSSEDTEAWVTFEPAVLSNDALLALFAPCDRVRATDRLTYERDEENFRIAIWLVIVTIADKARLRELAAHIAAQDGVRRIALNDVAPV